MTEQCYKKWDEVAENFLSNAFDTILSEAAKLAPQQRLTTPTYKSTTLRETPPSTLCYSAPLPFSVKSDINPKQGIIVSYLSVYDDPTTGQPFIDSYLDIIDRGSFTRTISELDRARKAKYNPYLVPYLWQHDRKELIGGIKGLTEDSRGVVYEAQVHLQVQRGREAFALAEERMIGSSFGYDPVRFYYKPRKAGATEVEIRHLAEIVLHEASLVTFPANPHASLIDMKSKFYVPALPYQNTRLDALSREMHQCFATLDRLEKKQSPSLPDFPQLPDMAEAGILDLLASIQREMS